MPMIPITIRIEEEMYRELKNISAITGVEFSKIVRDLIKIGYVVLRPDIKIPVRKLIETIVPLVIEEIEKKEKVLFSSPEEEEDKKDDKES